MNMIRIRSLHRGTRLTHGRGAVSWLFGCAVSACMHTCVYIYIPGALNDCFKAGAGRKTTSEANDRNRFEIPSLRGLDFARPVYFPFFPVG